jgi:hypothetical protein
MGSLRPAAQSTEDLLLVDGFSGTSSDSVSQYWPIVPTKDDPKQIAEMVTLKRRTTDVVFHFVYPDGHEDSVDLRKATLEKHKDYEVLYIK